VLLGLASALFFTATYVLNRAMAGDGGHWAWSAALRYLLTLPMLALVMPWQGGFAPVWGALRSHPGAWLLWSGIGFALFCVCLTWAAAFAPAWLVAGTFQLTVIAGMLLGPLLYRDGRARLPRRALALGGVIVAGVAIMQAGHFHGRLDREAWLALAAVAAAAFLYPLGNRAILLHLERSGQTLNATQRVFGMTLASQPFWWLVAAYAGTAAGAPSWSQVLLAAGVALFAGTIATILFFQADRHGARRPGGTRRGRGDAGRRAAVLHRARCDLPRRGRAERLRGARRRAGRRRHRRARCAGRPWRRRRRALDPGAAYRSRRLSLAHRRQMRTSARRC
jgi:drug/metabolite transporter (DMT)-like permease